MAEVTVTCNKVISKIPTYSPIALIVPLPEQVSGSREIAILRLENRRHIDDNPGSRVVNDSVAVDETAPVTWCDRH